MFRFRTAFYHLLPPRFTRDDGEKVHYSLSLMLDAFITKARAGLEARFPSRAGQSAQALIGAGRLIQRGRDETNAAYAERLKRWRFPRGHRTRGSAFALLEQISAYFGGIKCWTISRKLARHERTAAGVESYAYGYAWDWDGVAMYPRRSRFWVVLEPNPDLAVTQNETYDEAEAAGLTFAEAAAQGRAWGQTGISHEDANAIKRLLRGSHAWKPAGTKAEYAIVQFDGTPPVPDGSWGSYQGRDRAFSYWNLGS